MRPLRLASTMLVLAAAAVLAAACPRANGYVAVPAFPNITYPNIVGLYPIPGDVPYAAVVTQDGVIYRANLLNGSEEPTVFLDLSSRLIKPAATEEGLLGLAFAPDYPSSHRFYVYYSAPGDIPVNPAGTPRKSVLSRFDAPSLGAEHVILEVPQPFSNHNGGALAFGPDGMLYVGLGDGGDAGDPMGNGQDTDTLLGKILRIDVSGDTYTIPADNPLVGQAGRDEIWAWGFRNPWRITFDPATGQLWAGDVGQNVWEEVDRVVRGGNYGWNVTEGNACYNRSSCQLDGFVPPRVTYHHQYGCSITGGYVYRGGALPELQGWYIYGDFCSGKVWAVDAGADAGAAIPLADTNVPISTFAQTPDGEVYLVSYSGGVYRLAYK